MSRDSAFALAKENAMHALQIDKNQAEAHCVLGQIYALGEWKWEKAREEFQQAIKESPDDPYIHARYSELLNILGENAAAREQINLALQMDPTIFLFHRLSMDYYFNQGKLKESLKEVEKINEFRKTPQPLTLWNKAYIYDRLDDDFKAIQTLKEIMKMEVPETDYSTIIDSTYKKNGAKGVHILMLNYLKSDSLYPQYFLAQIYGRLGMNKEAMICLRKSFEKRDIRLPRINNDPRCVYIRKEPGFREIIEKMGLGPYFDPDKDFSPVAKLGR